MIRLTALLLAAAPALAQQAEVQTVPDFGDFLVVDGKTVWMTNRGRVEQWSRSGRQASVALPGPCGAMAIKGKYLWVADCKLGALHRIDTRTATLVQTVETGIADKSGELNVVFGGGSIWVASDAKGEVARVNPKTGAITARIAVDPGTSYLAFGEGALWAVSAPKQSVQRIDPAKGAVTARAALGKQPGFLAAGAGGVWVQEQGDGTLVKVDPKAVTVAGRVKVGANLKWGDIDTGASKVWLRTTDDQEYVVIDAKTQAIIARVGPEVKSGALRWTRAGVWTSAHDVHTLKYWPAPALGAKN
ncbi:Vgb family protein [Sandarakinorhabdus oryzae]|uniref:Vgb family protein n=1 Tax=Sandarakinorhabdus oryzae TaxID=2675220 RepID=UPI0012E21038|nr:YncE family protein [Sandarakinorhabdus oryzae]